jgi:hypothetical protein
VTRIQEFQKPIKVAYPDGNFEIFEQWMIQNCDHPDFLPINWCGWFVNNNYGKARIPMQNLQRFVNGLDKNKRWFCCTQYDLGVLTDISNLNIKVFGSGGGRIDFPIPLICKPHGKQEHERTIFANFIGSITHPIRKKMVDILPGGEYYVSTNHHPITVFCDALSRSIFTLCPRGFGLTSFRICEALEQGSIPVYISDEFIIPGHKDFNEYGVLIHTDQINEIDDILKSISPDQIVSKQEAGKRIYEEMFTFEGCKKLILDNL